jgi:hypothetical protein
MEPAMTLMPRGNGADAIFLAKRLMTAQLDDTHFTAQLVERLRLAVVDAERIAAIGAPQ